VEEPEMAEIKSRLKSVADREKWAARGASFVAKTKATKVVWFPPRPANVGKNAAATAKRTTKQSTGAAKKATKKSTGAAKKATTKTAKDATKPARGKKTRA
jgi:K+-sensing histidine kinase KdpD